MHRRFIIAICVFLVVAIAALVLLIACSNDVEAAMLVNVFTAKDDTCPVLVEVTSQSSNIIRIEFSEPVRVFENSFEPFAARADGKFIYVSLNRSLPPGAMSTVSGRVRDYSGNTTGFSIKVYGYNPLMPRVLINEFTTKGTEKSPDRTELLVLEDGNINGMSLYGGIPDDYDTIITFGDVDVKKDDLLVVWWTTELPTSVTEGFEGGVYHICAGDGEGLASNNGTLVLCGSPSIGAVVLDAVVYSNYTTSNEGYGTRQARERAQWVLDAGLWKGDAIESTSSTATRSMSRILGSGDTNGADDWYITVTGGSTFGLANTSEAY